MAEEKIKTLIIEKPNDTDLGAAIREMFSVETAKSVEIEEQREEAPLVSNQICTPDGTILTSKHRYDFVTYKDANGEEYMVDGGTVYLRRNINKEPYKELSLTTEAPFEEIRKVFLRGGRGKDGRQPLKWVALCDMSNEWVKGCIDYCKGMVDPNHYIIKLYEQELKFRDSENIFIEDAE